jgi:chromosomal replication initiation ATPase DnaA
MSTSTQPNPKTPPPPSAFSSTASPTRRILVAGPASSHRFNPEVRSVERQKRIRIKLDLAREEFLRTASPSRLADSFHQFRLELHTNRAHTRTVDLHIPRLIDLVCREFHVTRAEMFSPSRTAQIALARMVAMTILRGATTLSLEDVAKMFGRHHTCVCHATQTISALLTTDQRLSACIQRIRSALASMPNGK